jgi:hypothetical protein
MRVALGMAFAHIAALLAGTEPAKAQGLFGGLGPPTSYQYFQPPSQYVAPLTRSKRREIKVSVPPPETTLIDEKYAKGSIVIVNHERNLYFVEETGTRHPLSRSHRHVRRSMGGRRNNNGQTRKSALVSFGRCPVGDGGATYGPSRTSEPARASRALLGQHSVPHPWDEQTRVNRRSRLAWMFSYA